MADTSPPLDGVRVLERADGLPAAFAGFLLAGLGADVVRVDAPASGPPDAGARVLQRGKRTAILDLTQPAHATAWDALAGGADVVLVDESATEVTSAADALRCRVAGRALPGDEPLIAAAAALDWTQWSWAGRPVWLVTPMISYMTGLLAALGVTGALLARRRGAPAQTIDVDGLGGAFALNSGTFIMGPGHQGSLSQFGDPRGVYPNYSIYPTADGWIFVGALTQAFWTQLCTVMDRTDLLADPRLQGHVFTFGSRELREYVRGELDPIFRAQPTAVWIERLRAADIPCGPVRSRLDALGDPEARALGLVVPLEDPLLGPTWQPGVPAVFSDTPAPAPRPAPVPGTDTEAVLAAPRTTRRVAASKAAAPRTCLEGVRVLDLTSFIAGPFCPMLLADLGADVVKVESREGDPFRMAAFGFIGWNRGKRSLVLDLKQPAGRDVLLDLARAADVVVDNFRAGVMERLGIGWDALGAANPRLVHTSITGFGTTGPFASLPGFDPVFQARTGLMHAQGGSEGPVFHMVPYNDYFAGALAALATVAALLARERTGRGQRVDVSLFRTSYVAQAAHLILHPAYREGATGGTDHLGPAACRRLYPSSDGWICVVASTRAQAAALGRLAGTAVGLEDPAAGASAEAIARALAGEPRESVLARLEAAGVPAAPCRTFAELFTAPELRTRETIVEQAHPTLGRLLVPGPFIRLSATPIRLERSAPALGADGAAVLREIGYADSRIAALVDEGVVGRPA